MKIIKPSFEIMGEVNGDDILRKLEYCARTCYQSRADIKDMDFTKKFVGAIISRGHESVLEHVSISVRVVCDRAIMAELTRHRHCAFSVESTRYCNYHKDKFGAELTFIDPDFESEAKYHSWKWVMQTIEDKYNRLIIDDISPEMARSILPNCLKSEMIITTNLREWRHILKLRCAVHSHPQVRGLCNELLREFRRLIPVIFDDLGGR